MAGYKIDSKKMKRWAKEMTDEFYKAVTVDDRYMERLLHPVRTYHPHTLAEVRKAVESGYYVIDDSIDVKVKDDWHRFSEGSLPCQRVTVTFDFIRLDKERGEIPFDRELKENGYWPNEQM